MTSISDIIDNSYLGCRSIMLFADFQKLGKNFAKINRQTSSPFLCSYVPKLFQMLFSKNAYF